MPRSVEELLLSWSLYKRKRRNSFWETAPAAVAWTVWKERNFRAFENIEMSMFGLKDLVFRTLFCWCGESSVVIEFLDSISVC